MKKIFSVKTMLLLLGAAVILAFVRPEPVLATDSGKYVVDMAGILSSGEEQMLESKLSEMSDRLNLDIVVVTTDDLGGKSPMAYADDYYDYNGFRDSGCLFLRYINGDEKEVWISTKGHAIQCMSDSYIQEIFDDITPEFRQGDYYKAFVKYADKVEYAVENYTEPPLISFVGVLIALAVGLIAAGVYTGILKGQLKSVEKATNAKAYESAFELTSEKDRFLRRSVTKVKIESSSSSGGSSTHTSSSGSSHGGGGRSM